MNRTYTTGSNKGFALFLFLFLLLVRGVDAQNFSQSKLTLPSGSTINNPTSLQWGPDDRLYVAEQYGNIKVFTIVRNSANNYQATAVEVIPLVRQIPNHKDDGTAKDYNAGSNKRQVTGLLVAGTSSNPIVYVASSDPEIGAGTDGDKNFCTNSGIISKLYKEGGVWKKMDLVRGLPRSEENHAPNGMQIHNNVLYIAIGGFTNAGGVSQPWTYITEYALSAAILSIDLATIEGLPTKSDPTANHPYKYDIPTLDDPTRTNISAGVDVNDPWGGNDGMNQAKVVAGGPVQLFATGLRNAYDLVITKTPGRENKMFTIDNGPNRTWGGWPLKEGGLAVNKYDVNETGSNSVTNYDGLEFIGHMGTYNPSVNMYYGGHPCPIRANPTGAGLYSDNGTHRGWRNDNSNPNLPLPADWPPVPASMANPEESDYYDPGTALDKSLVYFPFSTNGFCEYTATGSMQGDFLAAGYNDNIYRIKMDNAGQVLNAKDAKRLNLDQPFASGFGSKPLDITAQGNGVIFPGTVWVATWGSHAITVFEPQDLVNCTGANNASLDEDMDGFNNAQEIANGTDPCSGSSKPTDTDGDGIADGTDTDDDNDGINDSQDFFAIDADNGTTTTMPTHYNLYNFDPGTGFYGLGFTGLMCNGTTDYKDQFDGDNLTAGGAVGIFTVQDVPTGTALNGSNSQKYGFQFGVKTAGTSSFTVKSAMMPQYFNNSPQGDQSQGIYIGTGDQDNYLSVALVANGGLGAIRVTSEASGIASTQLFSLSEPLPTSKVIRFYITVDATTATAHVHYHFAGNSPTTLTSVPLSGPLLLAITSPSKAMAVGVMASSVGSAPFDATWDYIEVYPGTVLSVKKWHDGSDSEKILVYPNPADDKIMISVESLKNITYKVKLYNNLGQFIRESEMTWIPGNADNVIDVAHLPNGIYYLQFVSYDNEHSATVKFIKE